MKKSNVCVLSQVDQSGRSMVEMMGVLAVTGVLSVGSIWAYTYAINKYYTNELVYEATKRAQSVSTQLLTGHEPNLDEFTETVFSGGEFGDIVLFQGDEVFGIQINGVRRGVCENLIDSMGDSTVLRGVTDLDGINSIRTCEEENDLALLFDRNLELGDDFGDGEANGTSNPRPKVDANCSNHGRFTGTGCHCQKGWGDTDCSKRCVHGVWKNDKCECNTGWCGSDCTNVAPELVTTTALAPSERRPSCNGNGTWIEQSGYPGGGYCECYPGYGGENCGVQRGSVVSPSTGEQTITPEVTATAQSGEDHSCSGHGSWVIVSDIIYGSKGACSCNGGWGGSDCSEDHTNDCSGHGAWIRSYNNGAGGCSCDFGWGGSDCSEDHRNACSGHGRWIQSNNNGAGGCTCNDGWGGNDCSQDLRAPCSNHGTWNGSSCTCDSAWGGSDCSQDSRAVCNNHGTWCGSRCYCDSNWGGSDCSEDHTNDCGEHGYWAYHLNNGAGGCSCNTGWSGSDCSISKSCSGHGTWESRVNNGSGGCYCDSGWGGSDCSKCSGHGWWNQSYNNGAGGCSCNSGWGGSDCSQTVEAACSGHGSWNSSLNNGAGGCQCQSGWGGSDCSKTVEAACSGHGTWRGSYCSCDSGWGGSDCSKTAEAACSGHGSWSQSNNYGLGGCECNTGWGGSDCSEVICSGHGYWYDDYSVLGAWCICSPGWGGSDCSIENPEATLPSAARPEATANYETTAE